MCERDVGRRSFLKAGALGAAASLASCATASPPSAVAAGAPTAPVYRDSGGTTLTQPSASLRPITERLGAVLNNGELTRNVAGALVGVSVGGEQVTLAHGIANLNTNQPFTEDTGFLLGSVTKVLVATVVLRLVERGLVDLDAPVQRYVPEFTLKDRDAASRITVRMLISHTNGIDAHTLCPWKVRGRDASRSYTRYLPDIGTLFEPGACVTYSNPGFVIAARVIEEVTGLMFEQAMQAELFETAGMRDATGTQTQAFMRRTAVGAYPNPETGGLRVSPVFTLGEGLAGGGTTLIVSAQDMLNFGRMHLDGGVAPNGTPVLADELVSAMRTTTLDLHNPALPPVGLGWWKFAMAGTTVYWHGGGSPGGNSAFAIIPEHDAVIISFATGPGMAGLNGALHNAVIETLTGRSIAPAPDFAPEPIPASYAGAYRMFQDRVDVEVTGDELLLTHNFEPYDQELREFFAQMWSPERFPPVHYRSIGPGLFARVGTEPSALGGYGRLGLLTVLPATAARPMGIHTGMAFAKKVS